MSQVNATVTTIREGSSAIIPIDVTTVREAGGVSGEIQRIDIRGIPNGGTFRLKGDGAIDYGGRFETVEIPYGATGPEILSYINDKVTAGGKLTSDNTNVADGATVTIGTKTYTFKTVLTPTEGEVLIGANADASLLNLINAINHTGTPGTDYSCAVANTQVTADPSVVAHTVIVTAITPGSGGNSIVTTETSTHLSWAFPNLIFGFPIVNAVYRQQIGNTIQIDFYFNYPGQNWRQITAITSLQGRANGEVQRISWDTEPGRGFWYLEDGDGIRTDGISFDADDATISATLNSIMGAGQVKVTQVLGVSIDVQWLLSGQNQAPLDVFTDHLFTADDTTGTGGGGGTSDTDAPIVQQVGSLFGVLGTAFSHTFSALNDPDSWTAAGVPEGMSFNEATAEFSGTPTLIGDFTIIVRAANEFGTSAAMVFVFTVLPSAAAAGGRRLLLDLSQRVLAYADTRAIADPLDVSLKDASFVFEPVNGVILPGAVNPGKLQLRAMPFVNNTANFDVPADLLIDATVDITDVPDGKQLLVLGEDWGDAGILGLFTVTPDPMVKTLIAQLRWRNGDDVAGHWQHSKLFKVNVSNTLFQT